MKVLHIITNLGNGGAENVLFRLVTSDRGNNHIIISLMDHGIYGARLEDLGFTVEVLNMSRASISLKGLFKLYKLILSIRPDVIQTWMYHADLIGGCMGRMCGCKSVLWGIRGPYNRERTSIATKCVIILCSWLSGYLPKLIVSNSNHAIAAHVNTGYRSDRFVCIPNGYDMDTYLANDSLRHSLRTTLALGKNTVLLGMVARFDPYKDHETLLQALSLVRNEKNAVKCLLVGSGMDADNLELMQKVEQYDLHEVVILMGPRDDIPAIMAALDIHVLSSVAESFPNVVAEAMAAGTPCVSTNVGDAALIIGNTGWVVSPSDAQHLARGILAAISCREKSSEWDERRASCRDRVAQKFSQQKMVSSFTQLWSDSVNAC